jgi:hypothetical protein
MELARNFAELRRADEREPIVAAAADRIDTDVVCAKAMAIPCDAFDGTGIFL